MPVRAGLHPDRGQLVDIGGRCLRVVRAGVRSDAPLVVFECGAFGCAADWAVVQDRAAQQGLATLAYDRAGLGYSDPGPAPRDARAIAIDLEALLTRSGETGPIILVGHSMAGLMLPIFIDRNPDRVRGVVLVDAVTPETIENPAAARVVNGFTAAMVLVGRWSVLGFMRPVSWVIGDRIGLEGEAAREKRRIYGLASHACWAAQEIGQWRANSEVGRRLGPYPPRLPVAVVTAGIAQAAPGRKAIQAAPALASEHGYIAHVPGAGHASLLGRRFADPILAGVDHVLSVITAGDQPKPKQVGTKV